MSDSPDRLGPFHGATASSGHPSGEYPAPRNYLSDEETASSTSLPWDDLFDWDKCARDGLTDVTTLSDVPSEGMPAAGSSILAAAKPVAATPNPDMDCPMPDAPSRELQPPHVWPRVPDPHPPRNIDMQLDTSPSPSSPTEMRHEGQSQATSPPSHKRRRVVKDREQTSQVRYLKACFRCKMNKSECGSSIVCVPCSKRPLSESACVRKPLEPRVTSTAKRWSWNGPTVLIPKGEQPVDRATPLFISFSESIDSPYLEVAIRQCGPRWSIAPGEPPSLDKIQHWMEDQIRAESRTDFEAEMDKLLLKFVRRPEIELQPRGKELLSNLFKMRCMWKVWSCKQLFGRPQPGSPAIPFNARVESIQDWLQLVAAQEISELEGKILHEIDEYVANKGNLNLVMTWFVLWQMILIYRQSLNCVVQQKQTNAAPIAIAVTPMNPSRHTFRETTQGLFEAIIVIYSAVFHKKTTFEKIRTAGRQEFADDDVLYGAYQKAWQTLPDFYRQVLGQVSPTDALFIECIITKESGILAKDPPARR
ncbi:hypothetical protein C8A00DRAFT_35670 [Chaetomidium leptoderma]|uniref:Zn(2)-C6 fungal-type domain-containing protein n=1 Tax=Chaetomidium leptoderma TaxID=669021 RepID=A0AAN6ZWS6_9PEZI|nr:hypothetical protein C8A00DRAFT_35670 [Chaetomidium leptoderma]